MLFGRNTTNITEETACTPRCAGLAHFQCSAFPKDFGRASAGCMKENALLLSTHIIQRSMEAYMSNTQEAIETFKFFLSSFELVFYNDWEKTKVAIQSEHNINATGTFLDPRVTDDPNNWANRLASLCI